MPRQSRTSRSVFVLVVFVFVAANYTQAESRRAKISAEFVDSYLKKTCPEYGKQLESFLKKLRDSDETALQEGADVNKIIEAHEKQFSCGEYTAITKEQIFLRNLRVDFQIFSMMYMAETIQGNDREQIKDWAQVQENLRLLARRRDLKNNEQIMEKLLLLARVQDLIDELRRSENTPKTRPVQPAP